LWPAPGRFETTLTRPDLYYDYYLDQFNLLLQNHGVELEVGTSSQPIPVHFSFAENDHVEGNMSARAAHADARCV
jgi:AMP nucleosidase